MITKMATAIGALAPLSPAWAIDAAAANVRARFFGLTPERRTPSPNDLPAVKRSIARHPLRHLRLLAWLGPGLPLLDRHQQEQHADQQLDHVDRGRRSGVGVVGVAGERAAR